MALAPVGSGLQARLLQSWWQPRRDALAWILTPLAWLYGLLAAVRRLSWAVGWRRPWRAPVPLVVVGNLIVGGAGKTPTVIALVNALKGLGYRPGVISRGYGRRSRATLAVHGASQSRDVGDEPLLIARATGSPVVVGERRVEAARALLGAHPEVDLLVSDDGLQHLALARDAEIWVFDERGVGNGGLLPAGPLRQPLPSVAPPQAQVLYNAPQPSTALPGRLATRALGGAVALADWQRGKPVTPSALAALRGKPLLAIAGIAAPQRFFEMLGQSGLTFDTLPLPDHAAFDTLPWPPGTADVVCTEKDAVKLDPARCAGTQVWVVGLDLQLPPELISALRERLPAPASPRPWTTA